MLTPPPHLAPHTSRLGTLDLVPGSSYLRDQEEARQRRAVFWLAPVLALWLASLALSLGVIAATVARIAGRISWAASSWLAFVALGAILVDYALLPLVERLIEQRDQYRLGRRGEDAAAAALQACLDGRWTLFRNLLLPDSTGDIDGVLIGPGGMFVLEVKSYSGRVRNVGDRWEKLKYGRWRALTSRPGCQARHNASRLQQYLTDHDVPVSWVQPVVVWAGEPGHLTVSAPKTPIWRLDDLAGKESLLWRGRPMSEQTRQQAVALLKPGPAVTRREA